MVSLSHIYRPRWLAAVAGSLLLGALGCGEVVLDPLESEADSLVGQGGETATGGTAGAAATGTGGVAFGECVLSIQEDGWVEGASNLPCRAQGAWYSYNDCPKEDPQADCTRNHLPEAGNFPNVDGRMCTSGTTATPLTQAEAAIKWGAGIAFDFNVDEDSGMPQPIGWLPVEVVGIRFALTTNYPIRVNFPTHQTLETAHFVPIAASGIHTIHFSDARQGEWVPPALQRALNPENIISVQFQVPTEVGITKHFEFCVDELTLLL